MVAGGDAARVVAGLPRVRARHATEGTIHIHVDPSSAETGYRIDAEDARLLTSLGISPTRHRARGSRRRPETDDEPGR
jgi:hypothetical protein